MQSKTKILENHNNYTIIDDSSNNCYYVSELPFLNTYKGTIKHDIALNKIKDIIDNYIKNHYIYNDYHIVWFYYGKKWDFDVYTIDKKWHSYTSAKSHNVFSEELKYEITRQFIDINKSGIIEVNKMIYQTLDINDKTSAYCKFDKIPNNITDLQNNLIDISNYNYFIIVGKEIYTITEDILRSYKLRYIENFVSLNVDDYIIIRDIDINKPLLNVVINMKQRTYEHDNITLFFIKKYLSYIFGNISMEKYITTIEIRTKPNNTFHFFNMFDLN